jgi:transportin-3
MAIAALAVQMSWHTCLNDVTNNVLNQHPELGPAVLELFRSIPEEADSNRLVLTHEEDLWSYRDMLRNSSRIVLGLCEHAVQSTNSQSDVATTEAVLSCLQSWIRIVDMDPKLVEQTELLPWLFDLLRDSTNGGFELAVDVVVELLRTYPSYRRGNEGLIRSIIPRAMALGQDSMVGQLSPFQKSIQEEDEDGMRGYCRIFTEMGESYSSLILSHEEMNQSALVELVLRCSAIPDPDIAGITLHFWYRFVMGLEELEPFEYRQIKIDSFAPQLMRLLSICTNLLRYPVGVEDLSADRLDDIEGNRSYFSDTIDDCCRLLGGDAVLRNTGGALEEECHRVAALPQNRQLSDWHGIEAYLFAIQTIAMYIPSDEHHVIPFVMGLIPQLPTQVPFLRSTACRAVGKYAPWLGRHPSYLQPLLPYLAQGLTILKCASSSAVAIREICEHCPTMGDAALQLYDGIVAARDFQRGSVGSGEELVIDLKNELEVLEGVCKAISTKLVNDSSISHDVINGYIGRLVQPIIASLKVIALPEYSTSPKQIAAELSRLTVLVQHLRLPKQSSPCRSEFILSLMRESWPMLDTLSKKHPRDFTCGEKLCRLHKHAMRECGAGTYAPMLEPLTEQTVRNFSLSLSSPYLYLASICVSEFGRNPAYSKLLSDMMANLSTSVFNSLRTADDLISYPDVVEEFFYLAGRMINYCPSALVQSPLLNSLLQYAALGMKLHHRDANRGTLNFLEATVSYSLTLRTSSALNANEQASMVALERAIMAEGEPLVINLAQALLGDLPAYRLDSGSGSIAGVLFYLNMLCPKLLLQWIQPPLVSAPEHAKNVFLGSLQKQESQRDEFNSNVRKFTSVCERSRKLQYSGDEISQ